MNFSEKLQALRKSKGLSQENLADEIGVSRQAVSKWELGISLPDMDKLIILSNLLGVSIDYLVKDGVSDTPQNGNAPTVVHTVERVYYPRPYEYEYKSKRTLFGLPLVHINFGRGLKKAKGILAIGNVAVGIVSIGCFSLGVISIGALSAGLVGMGAIALGLLLSAGAVSVGTVALGGLAIGIFAFGGCAVGAQIAIGGYAKGHIAIGDIVSGVKTIHITNDEIKTVTQSQIRSLLRQEYPNMWKPLADFIASLFGA